MAPPQLGVSDSPPVVPEAPTRRTRLEDIEFDDFDLDEEVPAPATDFVLEAPEEFAATIVGELPELALEDWGEEEEAEEELMPELPPVKEPTVLHLALDDAPSEEGGSGEPSLKEQSVPEAKIDTAPPMLSASAPEPKAKGSSPAARLRGLLQPERFEGLRAAIAGMPKKQKILAGGGLCLVPVLAGVFFLLGEEEPLQVAVPPPVHAEPAKAKEKPAAPAAQAAAETEKPEGAGGKTAAAKEAVPSEETAPAEEGKAESLAEEATAEAKPAEPEPAALEPAEAVARARALLQQGKGQEGLTILARSLEEKPDDTGLLLAQGELLAAQGDREGALEACRKAGAKGAKSIEAPLCSARQLLALGRHAEALLAVKTALEIDPKDGAALFLQADIFQASRLYGDAAEVYKGLLDRKDLRDEALLRLARVYMTMAQPHEVLALLEKEVRRPSARPALIEVQADAHAGMQQWKKAGELYRKIAKRPGVAYKVARTELARGRVRQAIPFLVRAAAEEASPPEVFRDLGYSYKEVGRRREAAQAFRDYLAKKADPVDRAEIEEEIAQLQRG